MPEKPNHRHPRQEAALEKDQARMEMAYHRSLDLPNLLSHNFFAPEKRQRSWIMTKEQHPLAGSQCLKTCADFVQVLLPEHSPLLNLSGNCFALVDRERCQGRGDSHEHKRPDLSSPESLQAQPLSRAHIAFNLQPSFISTERFLAEFMIADRRHEAIGKRAMQFGKALGRALAGSRIRNADRGRIARVISVRHYQVGIAGAIDKRIEQMIVREGIAMPKKVSVSHDRCPLQRISNVRNRIAFSLLLARAGVMNVR